ncbi:MAG: glycoside hydrolase family 97 catalytic domain-containing protein [Rikenellaceae bacterium]
MNLLKKFPLFLILVLLVSSCSNLNNQTVKSLDNNLEATLVQQDYSLYLSLSVNDQPVLTNSPILVSLNDQNLSWKIVDSEVSTKNKVLKVNYGEFKEAKTDYRELDLDLEATNGDGKTYKAELALRLYPNVMAYKIEFDDLPKNTKIQEFSKWVISDIQGVCFAPNGEKDPVGGVAIAELDINYTTPVIYQTETHTLAFHEAGLENYAQLMIAGSSEGDAFLLNPQEGIVKGDFEMPWRIVFTGKDIADLHNSKYVYQSMNDKSEGDYSWVKPGLSTWDWRVKGTTFDGFTYEMNDASLKRFIDFCSRSNIDYFLLDAEWYEKHDPLKPVEGLNIKDVINYGKSKNVGVILYYDENYVNSEHPVIDFKTIAAYFSDLGAVGVKFGFLKAKTMQEKTNRTEDLIKIAAKNKLIIDFHDGPVPFSGLERKYPNYISREYCHAQLDARRAFSPSGFVKIACINLLAGHIDQTNGTFALNEMQTRSKGPRNEYLSTVSSEMARFFITHTGALSVLIDAPEAYESKSDFFAFIKNLPKTWDETIYLEQEFDSNISVAKRKGDVWFAGTVFNEKGGSHSLPLSFLNKDTKYLATIYRDANDSHCKTNKEAYFIETKEIPTNEVSLEVFVAPGGGYTITFTPVK